MKLTVENFQIHKKKTVDIPEGQTTYLEGDSDIGKSALMRAIRWLCENKPDGGSFVTFKTPRGTCSTVKLEADGRTVERERGKSKNTYRLDGETFEAFGRSVPEPIAKFLNLSPYAFQLQGEVPFLIGNSATDAAKILSEACGLGVIDTAVAFVRGKKTVADAEIRKSEILLESAQGRLATATAQLPLADALEKAAKLGEDVLSLTDRYGWIAHVLDDEPTGELLDVEPLRTAAYRAHGAWEAIFNLTGKAGGLRRAIGSEPTGTPYDVEAVRPFYLTALASNAVCRGLANNVTVLQRLISEEPIGAPYDLEPAKMIAGQAHVIGGWLRDVTESRDRIQFVLNTEPRQNFIPTAGIAEALAKASAARHECDLLDNMCRTMRYMRDAEPQGVFEDTTKLQQLRAQIKVCPTCGREL